MASTVEVIINAQDNFSGVLGNFGSIITGIESAINLAGDAFRAFTGFALQGLDAIASYERIGASLEALVASQMLMSGAAESMAEALDMSSLKAEHLLGWVQQLAINSPFTQEGVAQALRMAMAYGFNVEEAQRLTQALIDFAAGTGAPEEAMSRIALALGQIEAKGKLSGQEILQLVNAGLPVIQILAEAFGKTTAEVTKMVTSGLVPANQAIEAITEYIETNFAGAAERQATTWAGLLGTFEDIRDMGLREFFGGLFDVLQPIAVALSTFLQGPGMEMLSTMGTKIGEAFSSLSPLVDVIEQFGSWLSFTNDPLEAFVGMLGTIAQNNGPLKELAENLLDVMAGLDEGGLLGAADVIVAKIFEAIETKIQEWVDGDGPQRLSGKLINWINRIGEGEGLMEKAMEAAGNVLTALTDAFDLIDWESIVKLMDTSLAEKIGEQKWEESGVAIGDSISGFLVEFFTGGNLFDDSLTTDALSKALGGFFGGAIDGVNWGDLATGFMDGLVDIWIGIVDFIIGTDSWRVIGQAFSDGLKSAFESDWSLDLEKWCDDHIVQPIRKFFGIASPSTVFMGIGRDLVLGLVAGISSLAGWAATAIGNLVDLILAPFRTVLDLLGIDTGGSQGGSSGDATGTIGGGGTTGGRIPTLPDGTSGTVVNQYFAGATINVGSWDQIAYDCVYPDPFSAATSGQLGGTTGGRTGAR